MDQWVKNLAAMKEAHETGVRFLGWEDSLEEEVATHCLKKSYGQRIPGLQSKGSQRVGHD